MAFVWIAGVAALIAIGVGVHQKIISPGGKGAPATRESAVYVIGDLHGDSECGKYWVNKLDLIGKDGKWKDPDASLVFMGDYIDKGPYGYQTIQFVKSLTDSFPENTYALLGNHEIELMRDRSPETIVKYLNYAYSAVHPMEYLNTLDREVDETDEYVVDLLLNASLEIYARRWHQSILSMPITGQLPGRHVITELFEESMRPLLDERLEEFQASYLRAFASNSTLGQWLEQRPVALILEGNFFTHGGLSDEIVSQIESIGGVEALNAAVRKNANDKTFHKFLSESPEGKAVYNMLIHRGNHKPGACAELGPLLERMNVSRLAVGHTPGKNVRSSCGDSFWAVDSLLGRWIRTSGNFYCPVNRRTSQDGNFVCEDLVDGCLGQVTKFSKSGVEIIS